MPVRLLIGSAVFAAATIVAAGAASGDVVEIVAAKDTTIFGGPSSNSNGAGSFMFVGRTANGDHRRALVQFDVASALPVGATITSATLTLHMSMSTTNPSQVTLHRLLADWGEAGSNSDGAGGGGGGAPAQVGDATWLRRFYNTVSWANAGGDFVSQPSAAQTVGNKGGVGFYDWESNAQMVADVQGWLDAPGQNHGWLMRGEEVVIRSTKRFDTRENSEPPYHPTLTIEFAPPRLPGDVDGDGLVDVEDLVDVITSWGPCPAPPDPCPADLDGNSAVDVADMVEVITNWT